MWHAGKTRQENMLGGQIFKNSWGSTRNAENMWETCKLGFCLGIVPGFYFLLKILAIFFFFFWVSSIFSEFSSPIHHPYCFYCRFLTFLFPFGICRLWSRVWNWWWWFQGLKTEDHSQTAAHVTYMHVANQSESRPNLKKTLFLDLPKGKQILQNQK